MNEGAIGCGTPQPNGELLAANLATLSRFEYQIADGDEEAFYAFDEWLADLPEHELEGLRLDHYGQPVTTPHGEWVERCWHLGCLSALIAPPVLFPDGSGPVRSEAAAAACEASGWVYTAAGRMFCPAHVADW
jgi:hypothetical protein